MSKEQRLIDVNAIPESATAISTDGRLFVAWSAIAEAPTVDAVEVVHGRWKIDWIYERDALSGECDETPVATCPFCDHKEYGFAYDDYWGKPYNYCPNCGAKMDGDFK